MCRHLAYLGPVVPLSELLFGPPYSLYKQSWAPRRQTHGTVNADGFGIGWYPQSGDGAPARYRCAMPIWRDPNLPDLARSISSGAAVAAVRDATAGTGLDSSANAPFSGGRWLFSHNGAVPDWRRLTEDLGSPLSEPALLGLEASSDSALLWALIQQRLDSGEQLDAALATVTGLTAALRPHARLNLLLTDGHSIAATRWGDSLWYRAVPGRVLVASEPDTEPTPESDDHTNDHTDNRSDNHPADAGSWQEVPEHSLLLATATSVRITPLSPVAPRPIAERMACP